MSAPDAHAALAPRAMILAAGRGTRLRPLTDVTPKPMIEVAGRPLIAYSLGLLRAHGIRDAVVNTHHLGDRLQAALGDGRAWGVRVHYSHETELLDTGGGIRAAKPLLDALLPPGVDPADAPIVILNGDVVSDVPLRDVVRFHRERRALATFVLRDDPQAAAYGLFGCDDEGRIRRFLGKGAPAKGLVERMFASVHVLDPRMLELMPAGRPFHTMRELYPALFARGERFFGYRYDGPWYAADTPDDLAFTRAALAGAGLPAWMRDLPLPAH
ncbi:NDP-sugar synthase [Candidatus Binatia bacterium]|jgi:NDP-sugar pyrophosphorylase family protein|nr:NDP-sugar synthase [Candidatus Binatia bacterium]